MNFQKKIIYSKNEKIKFPYIIYIPETIDENASLIVDIKTPLPMSGSVDIMIDELLKEGISYNPCLLMEKFKYPVMSPLIPRPVGFYTSYLGSKVIKNDFSELIKNIPIEDVLKFKDIDMQVYYMIKEANEFFGLNSRAIINGYSAGAKFATGFSILHPDIICCNLSGGTSGLSTLPIERIDNLDLPYPIGVYDINFDLENFKKIKHFFYIGENDNNNPALPLCELSIDTDVNGNPLPKKNEDGSINFILDEFMELTPYHKECYTKREINIIDKLYGHDNIKRFNKNALIYKELGIDSIHKIYPGNHGNLFRLNREELIEDMINCIKSVKQKEVKIFK